MVNNPIIEVVMPTFNGIDFLEDQIRSIYNQTLRPKRLIVRDDGSTDGTVDLLYRLKSLYGEWLCVHIGETNLGCTECINQLLYLTSGPYVSLADQDDIWLPQKLEHSYRLLYNAELNKGLDHPILVHTNLNIVDSNLTDLGFTYTERQLINPYADSPSMISLTNVVTGCTILCNRALLNLALPIPKDALVHDWWISLVASVFGNIEFLPWSTMLYRQHSRNVIGAKGFTLNYWLERIKNWLQFPSKGGHTLQAIHQIKTFEDRFRVKISPLPDLIRKPRLHRIFYVFFVYFCKMPHKHGVLRTLAFYFWLFTY